MKLIILSLVIAFIAFDKGVESKVFTRCELAKALVNQGFPRNEIANWVCLVEHESGRNTSKKGGPNKNKSFDHGLFQINDKYWCSNGKKGKDCNARCEDLRTDDITEASKCAKKVYARHGFEAWYGWKNHCKKSLPEVNSCF